MSYSFFNVKIQNKIAHVAFNRPEKANALHEAAWEEMHRIFDDLATTPEARVIILSGEGKHFCAGIDLETLMSLQQFNAINCEGRKREKLRKFIVKLQKSITAIEDCRKPVIAAIHNGCIGGAVDIVSACDMRFCTEDAYFTIKEIDLGLVADLGTMQRLPNILNPGIMAEMAYTGRKMHGDEAERRGLVNRKYASKEIMMKKVEELATTIAGKSPVVVRGTKEMLLYKRDHSVADALNYVATWNAGMVLSNDLMEAFASKMQKRKPEFED